MPAKQRKLTSFPVSKVSLKAQSVRPGTQRRLTELKKVVSIRGGAVNFDVSELSSAKAILDCKDSADEEILEVLRRLSCFKVTKAMLIDSGVGHSVRCMKKHENTEIARVSRSLVEKWKESMHEESQQTAKKVVINI